MPDGFRPPPPPREYVGQARQLRAEIAAEDAPATKAINTIVGLLLNRAERHPTRAPRRTDLIDAARAWQTLPTGARLALSVQLKAKALAIDELRLTGIDFRFTDWPDADFEPAVSVLHARLCVAPHKFELETPILACCSLHALARRYQRGFNTSRAAILSDLGALAGAPDDATTDEREVRTQHGRWIGAMVTLRAGERTERALVARTFY